MNYFTTNSRSYQLKLPVSTEIFISENSPVRMAASVIEKLGLESEAETWAKRKRDIPFTILLRVVVYAFMRVIRSVRAIETACRENINFMWLLEGYRVPDHNMLARFIKDIDINGIFIKVNKLLIEAGELKFTNAFVDGTKIEANANRYSFVWKGTVEKNRAKLLPNLESFLREASDRYGIKFLSVEGFINYLEQKGFEAVCGKGKRKSQEQRDLERAKEYFGRLQTYDTQLKTIGDSRNNMSKTDPDATFMRLKEDHMRNGQLKAAYNIQLCVESEYITGLHISSDRNDLGSLIPLMKKVESDYGKRHENVTADAGYESEENYAYLAKCEQKAYIKPQNYEQSKTKKYKSQLGRKENMKYDANADEYTCAAVRKLKAVRQESRKTGSGYEQTVTVYRCESCEDCHVRNLCTKAKEGKAKEIEFSRLFEKYRAESLRNIISEKGIQLRVNRSIQIEGIFGIIKQDYGFRRFNRRGKKEISTELTLICLAYNLNKLYANLISGRMGFSLYRTAAA